MCIRFSPFADIYFFAAYGSFFEHNSALNGGALTVLDGPLDVTNSQFLFNFAVMNGGMSPMLLFASRHTLSL